jgi:flagellar basal body-associated protein FliL
MKKYYIIFLSVLCFLGCSGGDSANTDFLGTWRMEEAKGQHTILSLRNNGTFQIDIRFEGDLTKIIEKKGNATGTYEVNNADGLINLKVTGGNTAIGWPEGETIYRIGQMDKLNLVLISPDGRELHWKKSSRQDSKPETATDAPTVTLAPLVVSLMPGSSEASRRYKWLCVALDIQLSPGSLESSFQPRLKDKIILLLSNKAYEDINTLEKLETVSKEIRAMLNPYLDGTVDQVLFNRTIVTGRQEAVDEFCAEYQSEG